MNHGEYGTSTLRNIMRRVLKHNPDYVLFFEWNEANENTCFQPTVYSGQTVGRLIKYYSHLSKGKPFAPYAGEDASIPNLTLSHRATLKPGEVLRFELLNIPDGTPEPYDHRTVEAYGSIRQGAACLSRRKDYIDTSRFH